MNERLFLDTNILIYSISSAPTDAAKRDAALVALEQPGCCLSVQVLSEFYAQATRPSRPHSLSHDRATVFVTAWKRFQDQENTVAMLDAALDIVARHGFSYWDSGS